MTSRARLLLRRLASAALVTIAAAAPSGRGGSGEARADAPAACTLKGTPIVAKTVVAFSAAQGGDVIAKFTGQPVTMALTLPTAAGARAALRTGSGSGGFRLEGFVDARDIPVFTTRNVPVVADHVWIGGPRRVKITGSTATQVSIELTAGAPIDQTLKATAGCDAVALDLPPFRQQPIPGHARGYLAKKGPLDLRGEASGPTIFTFTSSEVKDSLLFWSTERKGAAVHVHLNGDVVVDGWIAATDLEALKEGEMMDALAPGNQSITAPKLMMAGTPVTAKVSHEVTVRRQANDQAQVIGAIEAGGEVLVLETVLGWSNVVPTALHLMPPESGGGFWVKTSELGISQPSPPAK